MLQYSYRIIAKVTAYTSCGTLLRATAFLACSLPHGSNTAYTDAAFPGESFPASILPRVNAYIRETAVSPRDQGNPSYLSYL